MLPFSSLRLFPRVSLLFEVIRIGPTFLNKKCIFGANVCVLACIRSIRRMFIVRFGLEKPEDDTVPGLSVLYGMVFRVTSLLMLFPIISINKCHYSFGQFCNCNLLYL